MTEAEWLASGNPEAMLGFLRFEAPARKLRLFACACCRRIWPLLTDPDSRHAVEVSERYADGRAGPRDLGGALTLAAPARGGDASVAAYWAGSRNPAETVGNASAAAIEAVAVEATREARAGIAAAADPRAAADALLAALDRARAAEARAQADLLRDLFNPFRPAAVDPSWLTWHGGTVRRLAGAIYEERRFGDLPVLADALEEAGCSDPDVLRHCRQPGEHVLGCWVVDRLREGG